MDSELRLQISEEGADAERLAALTSYLRAELLQLDVEDVSASQAGEAPPGARVVGVAAVGALLVALGQSADGLRAVVSAISAWLRRGEGSHATTTLQDDGLSVNPATTSNCAASSDGQVVGQTPSEGTSVHQGSAVVITVCSASQPGNVTVPNLLGLAESQAEAVLQSDGLIAAPTLLPNCEAGSAGQVVQQSPDAGTAIQQGHTVGIGVCEPPTPSPSPSPSPT